MNTPAVEIKGSKVYRNGKCVGAIWEFGGDWYCRILAGQVEGSSKRFHSKSNAITDALTRARNVSDEDVAALEGAIISKVERPKIYSD